LDFKKAQNQKNQCVAELTEQDQKWKLKNDLLTVRREKTLDNAARESNANETSNANTSIIGVRDAVRKNS